MDFASLDGNLPLLGRFMWVCEPYIIGHLGKWPIGQDNFISQFYLVECILVLYGNQL